MRKPFTSDHKADLDRLCDAIIDAVERFEAQTSVEVETAQVNRDERTRAVQSVTVVVRRG